MDLAASALLEKPCGETIIQSEFSTPAFEKAMACNGCRTSFLPQIQMFNRLFAAEVERVIGDVSFLQNIFNDQ